MTRTTTLLELVTAITRSGRSEAEVVETVMLLVNSGVVRLGGTFAGARLA